MLFETALPSSATNVSNGVFSTCVFQFLEELYINYLEIHSFIGQGKHKHRSSRGIFRAGTNPGGQGMDEP